MSECYVKQVSFKKLRSAWSACIVRLINSHITIIMTLCYVMIRYSCRSSLGLSVVPTATHCNECTAVSYTSVRMNEWTNVYFRQTGSSCLGLGTWLDLVCYGAACACPFCQCSVAQCWNLPAGYTELFYYRTRHLAIYYTIHSVLNAFFKLYSFQSNTCCKQAATT